MEQEKLAQEQAMRSQVVVGPQEVKLEAAPIVQTRGGVKYCCPLLPDILLPRKEMEGM